MSRMAFTIKRVARSKIEEKTKPKKRSPEMKRSERHNGPSLMLQVC